MAQVTETNKNSKIKYFTIIPLLTLVIAFFIFSFVTKTLIFAEEPRTDKTNYTYSLEELVVNLKDGNRYFKTVVAMGYNLSRDQETIANNEIQIRDICLTVFRNKGAEELLNPENESKLKSELKEKINKLFPEEIITDIYFVDFLIQ